MEITAKDRLVYNLAIKRGNNDYLPLDVNLTSLYNGQHNKYDFNTLIGIDLFTSSIDPVSLMNNVVEMNLFSLENDNFEKFVIIFKEKGKIRELTEGVCFRDQAYYLNYDNVYAFLCENYEDKVLMNKIYNYLGNLEQTETLKKFRQLLNNVDYYLSEGEIVVNVSLWIIKDLDYYTYRKLAMYIANNLQHDKKLDEDVEKLSMKISEN